MDGTIKRLSKTVPLYFYFPVFAANNRFTAKSMSRAKHTVEVSVSPYLHTQGTPSVSARIPLIIQYLCRLVVCSRGAGRSRNGRKAFPGLPVEKNSRFSPLTCPFGVSCCPVVSEGVLPFQLEDPSLDGCRADCAGSGPSSFTICRGFTRALSTVRPQWRVRPRDPPCGPTLPSTSPTSRISPTFALISDRCP